MIYVGSSWGSFWALLGLFEVLLGIFGGLLGPLGGLDCGWTAVGPSSGHLWGHEPAEKQTYEIRLFLEPLWHSLWRQLTVLGPSPGPLGRSEVRLGAIFVATNLQKSRRMRYASFGSRFGILFGASWALLGPSPGPLGRSEICLRAIFLATNLQKSRPQEPRDRREKAHHGLKMATKWVAQQSAACEAMRRITPCNPEWLQEAPKWPEEKRKIAPRWPQEHQDCRKKAQDGPKMATNWLAKPQERHRRDYRN